MKTIYIDGDFKCQSSNDGTMIAVETDFFDEKCASFVEGYRFVPAGETWTREDGQLFRGEMIAPWKDYSTLEAAQQEYEKAQATIADMEQALNELGVNVNG